MKFSGIEQHDPLAEMGKIVLEEKVVEDRALGNDVFQKSPQRGDVPLTVAELVNESIFGFLGRDAKGAINGGIGRSDAHRGVEDDQRLPDGVENVLGEVVNAGKKCLILGDGCAECWETERFGHGSPPGWINRSRSQGA